MAGFADVLVIGAAFKPEHMGYRGKEQSRSASTAISPMEADMLRIPGTKYHLERMIPLSPIKQPINLMSN